MNPENPSFPNSAEQSSETPVHTRRIRYRGTHPRKFQEKYKELNPEDHKEAVAHVISRGQTPAGMHIPICVPEILDALKLKPGMIGLDATLGYGGHTRKLLNEILPTGHLTSLDVDPIELPKTEARLRAEGYAEQNLTVRRMNFAALSGLVYEFPQGFDFILADLGVSSMQLDTPSRGFSYKFQAPLDLRLNPQKGESAAQFLMKVKQDDLAEILFEFSDEPQALRISELLCASRAHCATTKGLAEVIKQNYLKMEDAEMRKMLQRVFQALRIQVNQEFSVLDQFLTHLPAALAPGGRVAILTFHSGEDRRVKHAFQEGFRSGIYESWSKEPVRPSFQEQRENPRSTCAKLRFAVKAKE